MAAAAMARTIADWRAWRGTDWIDSARRGLQPSIYLRLATSGSVYCESVRLCVERLAGDRLAVGDGERVARRRRPARARLFRYESGRAAAIALFDTADPPTATIASNDQMALTTLEVCHERGIAISDDVSLVSLDSTPVLCFTHTSLSAIDQPIADVAARAIRLIIADVAGEEAPAQPVVVPAKPVVDHSKACCLGPERVPVGGAPTARQRR